MAEIVDGNVVVNKVVMQALDERCTGCERIATIEGKEYCSAYSNPVSKWRTGHCNLATHVKLAVTAEKTKVNPLKASKRAAKGK